MHGAVPQTKMKKEPLDKHQIKQESSFPFVKSEDKNETETNANPTMASRQANDQTLTGRRTMQKQTSIIIEDDDDDDIQIVNSRPAHPNRRSVTSPQLDKASGSQNPTSATPPASLTTAQAPDDRARKRDLAKLRLRELQLQQEQVKIERELLEMD